MTRMTAVQEERRVDASRVTLIVLGVLATAIGAFLTYERARGTLPPCPVGGGGCATVQHSRYAELAGINVAVLGIVGYVGLLLAAAMPGDPGRVGGLLLSLVGFGFSAYLTYLELFVIDAICQWCVASAIVMTALAVLTVWRLMLLDDGSPGPRLAPA